MKRHIRPLPVILILLIVCAGAYIFFFRGRPLSAKANYVPYKSFSEAIDKSEVESATLETDRI
ncbi:MAG: hypothetical protein IKT95_07040, partial [Spirochaetales bacterium]|nr:hypothetical protein [Spirochaetales bacterium]